MPDIQFQYPTVAAPTTPWVPTHQPTFDGGEPSNNMQLSAMTGGGTEYWQDKGIGKQEFILVFERVTKADRDLYQTFFDAVNGAINQFEFLDRYGVNHTVRLLSQRNDLKETSHERFEGVITLRKEI